MIDIDVDEETELPADINFIFVVPLTLNGAVKQLLDTHFDEAANFVIAPWVSLPTANYLQLRNC